MCWQTMPDGMMLAWLVAKLKNLPNLCHLARRLLFMHWLKNKPQQHILHLQLKPQQCQPYLRRHNCQQNSQTLSLP